MAQKRIITLRWDASVSDKLRQSGTVSEGIRQAVEGLFRSEELVTQTLRQWTDALAALLGQDIRIGAVRVDPRPEAFRVWDGRDRVSLLALHAWALDAATASVGLAVVTSQHDLVAVWGLHVGRALGLDDCRARALGAFCHEWLGAWCDVSGPARDAADGALRVMAACLSGRPDEPHVFAPPPPPRRLMPAAEHEVEAYRRAWHAVLRFLRLHQEGRIRPGPWGRTRTWLLEDGTPAVPRLAMEAAGVRLPQGLPGGRVWKADERLFWWLPPGTPLSLDHPPTRDFVVRQVVLRGGDADRIRLLRMLTPEELRESLRRLAPELPPDVREVWNDILRHGDPLAAADHLGRRPDSVGR